ncbi:MULTISPECIES: AMP-binding protein [unclassified Bradyrhizobium]|uniref:AMP-binding protein n=1 Tax=unclassified Bradyrhizobium TaxID=2631580 RepID=UPI001FFB49C2|nr:MULTISPECIES: AMP-binding protein [unclassified Bradyrhizobium]MCK1539981.1 AMP-binding protein [Bradyrhizobium sp. 176]MCK1561653.1 AMP-binding protein [Bradyrhizobium sp. 171]
MAGAENEALSARLAAALAAHGAATVMRSKRYGLWQPLSGTEAATRIAAIARGLRAVGMRDNDVAAICGDTCADWVLADLGIMAAGGISAGLDADANAEELARVVNLFEVTILFVAGDAHLHRALGIRDRCPGLRLIVVMHEQWDDGARVGHVMTLAELQARGASAELLAGPAAASIAAIVMTSGVTAPARGALLTQAALGRQAARAASELRLSASDERLSLTPLHHVMERVVGVYASLLAGCIINFPESRETVLADLRELQPTVVQAPPRMWAKLKSGVELAAAEATKFQRRMVALAVKPGSDGPSPILDALVLTRVRTRLGLSRARLCLTTGAPARADVGAWFAAIRRPLTDAYGQAESGGAVTLAPHRGTPRTLDGVTLETLVSGEIRLRSDTLFVGYAGETENAVRDGWWHSGDVVHAGQPHPAGRVADQLDCGAASLRSEADLVTSPYVADAFLHRDDEGRVIAAVLMDADSVIKFAQDNSIPFTHFLSLCRSDDIRALIGCVIAQTNARAPVKIDDFTLIERSLGPGDPEMSAMLVLRRRLLRPREHSVTASAISQSA